MKINFLIKVLGVVTAVLIIFAGSYEWGFHEGYESAETIWKQQYREMQREAYNIPEGKVIFRHHAGPITHFNWGSDSMNIVWMDSLRAEIAKREGYDSIILISK